MVPASGGLRYAIRMSVLRHVYFPLALSELARTITLSRISWPGVAGSSQEQNSIDPAHKNTNSKYEKDNLISRAHSIDDTASMWN